MIKRYKIFLASSKELEPERKALEIAVKRRNELYKDTHFPVELELVAWEQLDEAMAPGGKQSQYDQDIRNCDIFVLLFWTKMGKFTDWDFDLAVETWKGSRHKKPQIFIYEKTAAPAAAPSKKDTDSLKAFKDKLTNYHKHYTGVFITEKELIGGFWEQMELVFRNDHIAIPESATVLTEPPAPPAYFTGRDDDLNEIRRRLKAGKKLMLINAEGGIGKTSLAASYWADFLGYYRLCAWLFCESGIIEELKKLAPGLGIDLANMTEAQQIAALKLKLGQEAKPDFLLVLDNANDPKQIQEFTQLFGGYTWHVLITSRCHGIMPDKSQEMPIKTLPPSMAKELFKNYYTENSPAFEPLLDQLLQRVGYNTLLVELFAKNMGELAKYGETLSRFLAGLEEKGFLLGRKSLRINTQYTGNTHKVAETTDDILNILYDFGRLDAGQTHLLVTLALLPATYYSQVFLLTLFKQLDAYETVECLCRLSELGWLAGEDQGYRLSPVIQQLVHNKHKDKLQQYAEPLIENINDQLENNGINLLDGNYKRAAPYAGLVNHIADQLRGIYFYGIGLLCSNAGVYYSAIGDWHNAFRNYKEYFKISKKILDSDPGSLFYKNNLAISHQYLGNIYLQKGHWQKALEHYEAYNQLEKELYEASQETLEYKNRLAISYSKLGEIYQKNGDWQKALEHYEAYNLLEKELYEESPETPSYKNSLAISYSKLGDIYQQKGDWQKALEHYEAYNRLEKELYESSPETLDYKNGLAISYSRLGEIYQQKGDWQKALENYESLNRLEEDLYEASPETLDYKNNLAISYSKLGQIYQQKGDWQKALEHYEAYNQLKKELYEASPETLDYKNGLAISYQNLGKIYQQKGDWQKALKHYEAYNQLEKELYESSQETLEYKNGLAVSYSKLGEIYQQKGDWQKALEHYEAFNKLEKELYESSPEMLEYKNNLAISHQYLGNIYLQKGDLQKALENYKASNQLEKELFEASLETMEYKNRLAVSYSKLGEIYQQKGDWQKALEHYEAFNRLEKGLSDASPETLEYKNGLAKSYSKLGEIYQQIGDWQKALEQYKSYNQIEKGLFQTNQEEPEYKNRLALSFSKIGAIYQQMENWKDALKNFKAFNQLEKDLNVSNPDSLIYKNNLSVSYQYLGNIYQQNNNPEDALKNYLEYNKLSKAIFEGNIDNSENKTNLATSYFLLGNTYEKLRSWSEAKLSYDQYLAIENKISDYWPSFAKTRSIELNKLINDKTYESINSIVKKIKELLKFDDEFVTHYTSLSAASAMILDESKFRISEGAFLNDTSEGVELFKFLNFNLIKSLDDTKAKAFIQKPFIGSFVSDKQHDDLTLWRMYGKENKEEAKGCAITINKIKFLEFIKHFKIVPNPENSTFSKNDQETTAVKSLIKDDSAFNFYRVAYRNIDNPNRFFIPSVTTDLNKKLNRYINDLKKELRNLKTNKYDTIKNINEILSEVAYLFKNSNFQYEKELRLVINGDIYSEKIKISEKTESSKIYVEPPKAYIELTDICPSITKITLGPKVQKAEEWAAAFFYQLKKKNFTPEIMISHLAFK